MAGIGIRVEGSDLASAAAGAIAGRADNTRELFEQIGMSLVASTQRRFETGSGPDGSPWPPSLRGKTGGKTLVDSARLMQSITYIAAESQVEVGSNVLYAAIHQLGGTIKPKAGKSLVFTIGGRKVFANSVTIPARPFLGIDQEDEAEIAAIAADWLLPPSASPGAQNAP